MDQNYTAIIRMKYTQKINKKTAQNKIVITVKKSLNIAVKKK